MTDFSRFEYLSFDCYGTLIDWETGILDYLRPLLARHLCPLSDEQILAFYSELEPQQQSSGYRSYRDILASVVGEFARELRFDVTASEAEGLAESICNWQPFTGIVPALKRLHSRYKLAVLSNIDDDLFELTAPKLHMEFDEIVTAQQIGSYKPSLRNFEALLQHISIAPERLLHVAESLYHDVAPARSLGIATVWVNRRQARVAAASRLAPVKPDLEVKTLTELADLATRIRKSTSYSS